jgi:hypothetical protein
VRLQVRRGVARHHPQFNDQSQREDAKSEIVMICFNVSVKIAGRTLSAEPWDSGSMLRRRRYTLRAIRSDALRLRIPIWRTSLSSVRS